MNITRYFDRSLLREDIISGTVPLGEALGLLHGFKPADREDFLTDLHRHTRAALRHEPRPALRILLDDIIEEELDTCA